MFKSTPRILPLAAILLAATARAAAPTQPASSDADQLLKQVNETLPPEVDQEKRADPGYRKTYMEQYNAAMKKRAGLARQFVDKYPARPESPNQLMFISQVTDDEKEQVKIYREITTKYPDSDAAKEAAGHLHKIDAVGKPFALSFTDAVSGKAVDVQSLKGKVVVIDFWATWCGPCVASMPHNKELYAKYHDKGLEFIGVSLDAPEAEGGLAKVKTFVADNQIPWPQYYQGNGWSSDFSKSWGVDQIPTVFLVAADGTLASTEAEAELDTLIPKLLAKRPAP